MFGISIEIFKYHPCLIKMWNDTIVDTVAWKLVLIMWISGQKKLTMELSRNQLHVLHVEIVISISMWMCPVISTTVHWQWIRSTVPPVHPSWTEQFIAHCMQMSWCSNVPSIVIGNDQQLLDVLLSSFLHSCIKITPSMFTQLQMIMVGDIVVIELATDIDRLIGKQSVVANFNFEYYRIQI